MFLVTDKDNKTFGGFSWGENLKNETDNTNHYFRLYETIEQAIFLAPFFGFNEFKVWSAEGFGECIEERTCKRFSGATTLSLEEHNQLTDEKRTVIAILCSLNLVKNQDFVQWCSSYLKGDDRTKEKAFIIRESICDTDEESETFSCAIPLLSSVSEDSRIKELTAASVFRAVSDSVDVNDPIDLNKIFKIASFVSSQEIAETII